ncbi:MAG TPA: SCO family protein [Arenicellales bacterium]|nr:SCO family protein [Nitrospinota bacterium]MDP6025076.1 SCO family protein [Pseudomonadales bacterium]MDP7451276.1 SCO family protein [Arenicellales bacterium]MDP7576052.1 SCO family protein [Pseudomonadales bacterium]HJL51316.1 SCO family protein [Arenicellales bacterium]
MRYASAWILTLAILSIAGGWVSMRIATRTPPLPVLDSLGGDFALPSTIGGISHLSDFRGDLVLLNFGYTSCPDVCVTVLARIRDVLRAVNGGGQPIHAVFVTLDPERDNLDKLESYIEFFDPSFVGMSGTGEQIKNTADLYKVFYEKVDIVSDTNYSISHSSHIYLLDTDGRVRATFGPGVTVPSMIQTVNQLQSETTAFTLPELFNP